MTINSEDLITDANKSPLDYNYTITLPSGKEIRIVTQEFKPSLFMLEFTSGGELAKELQGSFTSEDEAKKAINIWIDRKYKKNVSNKEG